MQVFSKMSEKDLQKHVSKLVDAEEQELARTLWKHAPRVLNSKGGLTAWDHARFVALCRWGFAAGYLTEAEAWKKIEPIARDLQKVYGSFEELGEFYCIGRECWRPGKNATTEAALEKLKTDASSPFRTTPWKLKLVKLDKPEKRKDPPRKP